MGNIISGRYGSVQRVLPVLNSDGSIKKDQYTGLTVWQSIDASARNSIKDCNSTTYAASMLDGGTVIDPAITNSNPHYSTVSAVTSWTLEQQMSEITYSASNTRGYKGRLEGTHNASGNISGIGAFPPIAPGQRFRFYGYVGPEDGKQGDLRGVVYRCTAIANSVQVQINYQLTNPITWTVGWISDWQEDGDELWCNYAGGSWDANHTVYQFKNDYYKNAGFWDYTKLDCSALLPSTKECMRIEGIDHKVCLVDANIQFNTETSPFTNSCSAKVGGWQSVVVGTTDCTVATNIHGDNYGDLYANYRVAEYYNDGTYDQLNTSRQNRKFWPGSEHAVRIYVGNNGDYWEFYKLMFQSFGGLSVDVSNNNPVQFSCNMAFNAFPKVYNYTTYENECQEGYIIYHSEDPAYANYPDFPLVDLRCGTNHSSNYETDDAFIEACTGRAATANSNDSLASDAFYTVNNNH